MPVGEIAEVVLETAVTVCPAIADVPILGRIVALAQTPHNDAKALEELQSEIDKKKKTRQKTRDKLNSKVIKISDAMNCVEQKVMNANQLWNFCKDLVSVVLGKSPGTLDTIYNDIQNCMIQKALQQKNSRSVGIYKKTKGPGIPKDKSYSEVVSLRKGKLHPFIPK